MDAEVHPETTGDRKPDVRCPIQRGKENYVLDNAFYGRRCSCRPHPVAQRIVVLWGRYSGVLALPFGRGRS